MWIKAGVLGDPGTRSSNLALWTMAGLGITIGLYSSRKWVKYFNRKLDVLAREENGNGIDRLPDDILCDIVSRLKINEASRTSILSKRWRKLWTMNDCLMFSCLGTLDVSKWYHDHVAYGDKQRFLKAVNQCLELHSGCKLKSFYMHCCVLNVHKCQLVRWMQDLDRLDVEELYLGHSCSTCNDKAFIFSFKLIDGLNRLKYLDLTSSSVETTFVGQCNSLLRLTLRRVSLLSHELSDILMSCPNLRILYMESCELPLNLRISGPKLKLETLKLDACYQVQKLEISDINIVKILIDIRTEVEISLSSVPKLESLHLRTPGMRYSFEGAPARDVPLLNYILIQTTYQILRLPSAFQVFGNVRVLCLFTKGCPYGEACEEVDLWNFAPVLVAAPLLEEFFLTVGGPVCKRERQSTQWPVSRHTRLEIMELSGFNNTQNELEFAKFILTNAQVLQILRLSPSFRRYNGDCFTFHDGKKLTQMDADAIWAYLQGNFLSWTATLELELE